jgi:hypothetical protein
MVWSVGLLRKSLQKPGNCDEHTHISLCSWPSSTAQRYDLEDTYRRMFELAFAVHKIDSVKAPLAISVIKLFRKSL